ncbi:MAG: hypothetical protein ACRDTC_19615 [Pseudonocardiaceae bacterium]
MVITCPSRPVRAVPRCVTAHCAAGGRQWVHASGLRCFPRRCAADKWIWRDEDMFEGQHVPVTRLWVQDLHESSIDWPQLSLDAPKLASHGLGYTVIIGARHT